jgi:large subunit ribosomal protein L15
MAQDIGLHSLKPKPGSRHKKKRVGRGEGSGLGKTSGRGENGYGSRSGAKSRSNFEGGQMPIHMRLRKLRGPHMKKSMPFEQFGRTQTQPVNLKDLQERFASGDEVTPESLKEKGLATRKDVPVKILGQGELKKKLTIRVHHASASAREAIEGAGGTLELLIEPKKKRPHPGYKKLAEPEPEAEKKPKKEKQPKAEPEAAAEPKAEEPQPEADETGPAPEDLEDQEEVNEEMASDAEIQPSGGEEEPPSEEE